MDNVFDGGRATTTYGREFFSHSPFRSNAFLVDSVVFALDIGYGVHLVYAHWNELSLFRLAELSIVGATFASVYPLVIHRLLVLREERPAESLAINPSDEYRLDNALNAAAGTLDMFACLCSVVALLLSCVGSLLGHLGSLK
jgi:hypothetical protein